ncbi:hypothetical protein BH09SUM1_BH09SUM1_03480 [soil metagenome]
MRVQKLLSLVGPAMLTLAPGGLAFSQTTCPPPKGTDVFFEDFTGALDPANWLVARRQWGGTGKNGGVRPETIHISDGKMKILTQGDLYSGPILGINKQGQQVATGHRVGGCLVTNKYFGSGSYEVRMKLAPEFGVCSTIWTFHYTENGSVIGNHEIDIETPGRPASGLNNISHNYALCNTWVGETGSTSTTGYTDVGYNLADGEFHTLRFDWHTLDANPPAGKAAKRVDFYFDDVLVRTTTTTVPTRAGRFWVGAWFPDRWAGAPNFDISTMEVDWVRITPFNEAGDQLVCETYPNDGFGSLDKIEVIPAATPTPPPTTPPPTTPPPTTPPPTTPPPTTPPPTTPPPTTPPPTTPPPTTPPPTTAPPTTPPPTTPPPTTPPPTTPPPTTPPPTTPPPTTAATPTPTNIDGFILN